MKSFRDIARDIADSSGSIWATYLLAALPLTVYLMIDVIGARWTTLRRVLWKHWLYISLVGILFSWMVCYTTAQVYVGDHKEAASSLLVTMVAWIGLSKSIRGLRIGKGLRNLRIAIGVLEKKSGRIGGGQLVCNRLFDDDYPGEAPRVTWIKPIPGIWRTTDSMELAARVAHWATATISDQTDDSVLPIVRFASHMNARGATNKDKEVDMRNKITCAMSFGADGKRLTAKEHFPMLLHSALRQMCGVGDMQMEQLWSVIATQEHKRSQWLSALLWNTLTSDSTRNLSPTGAYLDGDYRVMWRTAGFAGCYKSSTKVDRGYALPMEWSETRLSRNACHHCSAMLWALMIYALSDEGGTKDEELDLPREGMNLRNPLSLVLNLIRTEKQFLSAQFNKLNSVLEVLLNTQIAEIVNKSGFMQIVEFPGDTGLYSAESVAVKALYRDNARTHGIHVEVLGEPQWYKELRTFALALIGKIREQKGTRDAYDNINRITHYLFIVMILEILNDSALFKEQYRMNAKCRVGHGAMMLAAALT